MQEKMK